MRFVIEISGQKLLLTSEQASSLATLLSGCEIIENKYMGNSKYLEMISPLRMRDMVKLGMMSEDAYGAMVFVTKLNADK